MPLAVLSVAAAGCRPPASAAVAATHSRPDSALRTALGPEADPYDSRSYADCAIEHPEPTVRQACLQRAERLDPERPEIHFLRYVLSGEKDTAALTRARLLDPFISRTGNDSLDAKPGARTPPGSDGWLALRAGDYVAASDAFARRLASAPGDIDAYWGAATAFHHRQRHDSAARRLRAVIDTLRGGHAARGSSRTPLAFAEFALAHVWLAGTRDSGLPEDEWIRRRDSARVALRRAVAADLSFYHAHMLLGNMALDDRDSAGAVRHWEAVRDLAGDDVVARARRARYLSADGQTAEADRDLRALIAREPHWAALRLDLAAAIAMSGDARKREAIRAYEDWLAQAPREPAALRAGIVRRIAALRGG